MRQAPVRRAIVIANAMACLGTLASPAAAQPESAALLRALNLAGYAQSEFAPAFDGITADGRRVSSSRLRGSVVLLTFWATWCVPCRDELRLLEELHRDLGPAGLVIVGINARENAPAVVDYARALGLTFSLLLDEPGMVSASYGVVGLPTSFLIARDGRAIARAIGAREWTSKPARVLIGLLLADRPPRK